MGLTEAERKVIDTIDAVLIEAERGISIEEQVDFQLRRGITDDYSREWTEHCELCGQAWHGLSQPAGRRGKCPGAWGTEVAKAAFRAAAPTSISIRRGTFHPHHLYLPPPGQLGGQGTLSATVSVVDPDTGEVHQHTDAEPDHPLWYQELWYQEEQHSLQVTGVGTVTVPGVHLPGWRPITPLSPEMRRELITHLHRWPADAALIAQRWGYYLTSDGQALTHDQITEANRRSIVVPAAAPVAPPGGELSPEQALSLPGIPATVREHLLAALGDGPLPDQGGGRART